MTAAETGHLVFGTLHTQSAPGTIDRIIDVFPPEQQEQVRVQIAGTLQGVVTQALLPTADGQGRVPALEILLPDDAVRNLIRQGKVEQIYSVMQTGTAKGMQTMEQSLAELILRGIVSKELAVTRSSRPEQLEGLLERAGFEDPNAPAGETATTTDEGHVATPPPPSEPVFGGLRVAGS
jgi:twitching motility protein PilT